MNIEESIRELKGYLTWLEANGFSKLAKDSAIETLLTAYEKEKEKNKLLEDNYSSAHEDINWFCENYINKDKIKAKIEEVKDGTYDAKIVLQSLLEEE